MKQARGPIQALTLAKEAADILGTGLRQTLVSIPLRPVDVALLTDFLAI